MSYGWVSLRAGKLNGATAWLVVVVHRQAKLGGNQSQFLTTTGSILTAAGSILTAAGSILTSAGSILTSAGSILTSTGSILTSSFAFFMDSRASTRSSRARFATASMRADATSTGSPMLAARTAWLKRWLKARVDDAALLRYSATMQTVYDVE